MNDQKTNCALTESLLNDGLGTELRLSNENGEYSIRLRIIEMNIQDVFENLVVPVLLAAGYSNDAINAYLNADA